MLLARSGPNLKISLKFPSEETLFYLRYFAPSYICRMDMTSLFGYLAAIATTVSFIPQTIKTFRTRDTESLSLGMYAFFTFGVICWLIYGILLGEWPIILANTLTLALALSILGMKLRYG